MTILYQKPVMAPGDHGIDEELDRGLTCVKLPLWTLSYPRCLALPDGS